MVVRRRRRRRRRRGRGLLTEKQTVGKTLHLIRRKLETYKVRIYQSNVHCLKQQQKNLTDDQENVWSIHLNNC